MSQTLLPQPRTIYRAQTWSPTIRVTQNGEPLSLDGLTLFFHADPTADNATPVINLQTGSGITHRNQTTEPGVADIVVPAASTALLTAEANFWEVWLDLGSGNRRPIIPVSPLTVKTPVFTPV